MVKIYYSNPKSFMRTGFISKWTQAYEEFGISGLRLGYQGSLGYLEPEQRRAVIIWLQSKNYWNLAELQGHIQTEYEVEFDSKQSYYTLFEQAGISWKKTQKRNPKEELALVQKKQEITDWLVVHRSAISCGKLAIFFQDECHLLWGDLCGYVWGKTNQRIKVPIVNERSRQTYYGAVNLYTQQCFIPAYEAGNSEGTIAFLKFLLSQCPESRIALIWDGATHHRSQEVREYLKGVNHGLNESNWQITCIRFAPNAPQQKPIEDIWLQAKQFVREYYHLGKTFGVMKYLFELATHRQVFNFPKLFTYGCFSQSI